MFPDGIATFRLMVRRRSDSCRMMPPLVLKLVVPNDPFTGCRIVSPLVPSTRTWKRVCRRTGFPTCFNRKLGTVASPFTLTDDSVPSNCPDDSSVPPIPEKTPRSAFTNL